MLRFLRRLLRPATPWEEVSYWALDLETSGLDPQKDRVLSVGMVPVRGGAVQWGERFYSLVHPGSFDGLTREAITVHHILPEELEEAPPLAEVLPRVARRLGDDAVLLVHHAPLDVGFLKRTFLATGLPWPGPPLVDTRVLLARYEHRRHRLEPYPRPLPRNLRELRDHFDLPTYDYHHALSDALATAELFLVLRARLDATSLRQLT